MTIAKWRPTDDPVIITCALTGGIHGKEANPNLPLPPTAAKRLAELQAQST